MDSNGMPNEWSRRSDGPTFLARNESQPDYMMIRRHHCSEPIVFIDDCGCQVTVYYFRYSDKLAPDPALVL
jgi:hypothetical protein